jgi:uncharacterized membrane protein YhaH (DUF805 family)
MNPLPLFFAFTGRIPRSVFWFGFATTVLVLGFGRFEIKEALGYSRDESGLAVLLWTLLSVVPLTALIVKRLNDRARPKWIGYAYGGYTAIRMAGPYFGWFLKIANFSPIEHVVYWSLVPVALFAFIEAGFLPARNGKSATSDLS